MILDALQVSAVHCRLMLHPLQGGPRKGHLEGLGGDVQRGSAPNARPLPPQLPLPGAVSAPESSFQWRCACHDGLLAEHALELPVLSCLACCYIFCLHGVQEALLMCTSCLLSLSLEARDQSAGTGGSFSATAAVLINAVQMTGIQGPAA